MKLRKIFFATSLVLIFITTLIGCGAPVNNKKPSAKVYYGIAPKGDFITVSISGSTITLSNKTTGDSIGPVSFSSVPSSQVGGFHNVYQTAAINDSGNYLKLAILDGLAVLCQEVDSTDKAVGEPCYAIIQKPFTLTDIGATTPKSFNMIEFIPPHGWSGTCCFGCHGIADDGTGLYAVSYAAKYDPRDAAANNYGMNGAIPYGVTSINTGTDKGPWTDLTDHLDPATGTIVRIHSDGYTETLADTQSGVIIEDRGENGGGCFRIPQADQPNFKDIYSGHYLAFCFELVATSQSKNMKVLNVTLNTAGGVNGSGVGVELGSSDDPTPLTLVPFANFPSEQYPGGVDLLSAFQTTSNCGNGPVALHDLYKCYGSFIGVMTSGALIIEIDPSGNYIFFMQVSGTGTNLTYSYGFGIKDPDYGNE
ncbi:MAG TPA: hypothetical protein VHY08_13210 [Bacillota bacterium]|nr:hypothetical protein [Bacillota bacterium]